MFTDLSTALQVDVLSCCRYSIVYLLWCEYIINGYLNSIILVSPDTTDVCVILYLVASIKIIKYLRIVWYVVICFE